MTHAIAVTPTAGQLASLSDLEKIFFGYLADYNAETRALYEYGLNRFFTWCKRVQVDPLKIDRTFMALYVRHLSEECGLRGSTVGGYFTPVKGMYRWAMLEGFLDRDPAVHTRLPKFTYRQKFPLDHEELRKIRGAAKRIGGRHWALGEMMVVHALRIRESAGVRIEDCQEFEAGHRVMRLRRKGGGWETLPLPVTVVLAFEAAIGERTHGPVVARRDGGPLSREGATGLVKTIIRHAKLGRTVNPHLIRGSVITDLLDRGGDIREAQRLAGHQDPRTTSRHYDLSKRNHDTHPSHIVSARLTV